MRGQIGQIVRLRLAVVIPGLRPDIADARHPVFPDGVLCPGAISFLQATDAPARPMTRQARPSPGGRFSHLK
jgi:hypothetical protein